MAELCSQPNCPYPTGGLCLEGFDSPQSRCPHYGVAIVEARPEVEESLIDEVGEASEKLLPVHQGSELSPAEASALMKDLVSSVIVVVGPPESGKTTILTSIFDSFRRGPINGHQFAGSLTLPAFEIRCHPSRAASLRAVATTERTRTKLLRYLHLKVKPHEQARCKHLLFTDISGEAYRLARDFEQECEKLTVFRRADHFAAVLDGAQMVDKRKRAAAVEDVRGILRRAIGLGMINHKSEVEIICSKFDLFSTTSQPDAALSYLGHIESNLTSEFERSVARLTVHRVAARPSTSSLPFAFNIGPLFDKWISSSSRYANTAGIEELPAPARPFDRFGWSA